MSEANISISASKKSGLIKTNCAKAGINHRLAISGFILSWVVFAAILILVPVSKGLTIHGRAALAVMGWATVVWLTNALPMGISGLGIPLLLNLTGAAPKIPLAFSGFTQDVTFLILGCFMLAAIMQTTGLDRRIALGIISRVKPKVSSIMKGLMAAHLVTAILVPAANARGAVFLPIVTGLNNLFDKEGAGQQARKAITMLGIGFAALASGVFLLQSNMPNVIVAQTINQAVGRNVVTWASWAIMNWPMAGVFVIMYFWTNWVLKTRNIEIPGGIDEIKRQKEARGKMSPTEWVVLIGFALAIVLWATQQFHNLSSSIVTIMIVMALFIPGLTDLSWKKVQSNTIWGTWLLLCGSLSLVDAFSKTGVDKWVAAHLAGITPHWGWIGVTIFVCIAVQILRLGIVSNIAAVTLMAPVVAAMAPLLKVNTVAFTMVVLNLDSFAFILPISVTTCLIAFGTEEFSFMDFVKVGAPITFMVILYMVLIMLPWYALLGYPIWVPIH